MYKNKQTIKEITSNEIILFLDFGCFKFFKAFKKPTKEKIMAAIERTPIIVEII